VEIARRILREAGAGVPFDRIAVLLRAPAQYRAHLAEALRRARVPAYFATGAARPDPAGRAFLALLACAAEGLSARRFAEYLSFGEVPDATAEGAPPSAVPPAERWVPPDEELTPATIAPRSDGDETREDAALAPLLAASEGNAVVAGSLRAPRRWEQILVDAAVIGGRDRWDRRLAGWKSELELQLAPLEEDEAAALRIRRELAHLEALRAFARPLLDELAALSGTATWGGWLDRLSALATRALRSPQRVLAALAELQPMAAVGPVGLDEVRFVLEGRLGEVVLPPPSRRAGQVFVGPMEAARGLVFDVVFVPGLAERVFPQKIAQDPLLRDRSRTAVAVGVLATDRERTAAERLALRLAVGAARRRVVLSYSRVDLELARPRVPSFYALEVLRAVEGRLPGFDALAATGDQGCAARLGWPAPSLPGDAIDEAEFDLAQLDRLVSPGAAPATGAARYLITSNPHLARALRFRALRWDARRWSYADGLVKPDEAARAALAAHQIGARSFSPTALQSFARCPYKFLLYTIHKLAPREEPVAIEQMNPLDRGALVHEVLFEWLSDLRERGLIPIQAAVIPQARAALDTILPRIAARYRDRLAPAIDRVWDDGISAIRADLLEWLRREAAGPPWRPWLLELAFGLAETRGRDPASTEQPVALDCGINLRGSIDVVEQSPSGTLRATDYKTGRMYQKPGSVVGGGESLQPVLYALALERLFPDRRVEGGRLHYCTSAGEFREVIVPLDDRARAAAAEVAQIVGSALADGFFPAAPARDACRYCEYRPVCGPSEEERSGRKKDQERRLERLQELRKRA
jgi:RecB family exonuclease